VTTRGGSSPSQRPPGSSRLLTVDQAAERLNVSSAYVRRRLIFERRLPYVKIGRHVRIDEVDLEDFIDQGRVTPPGYTGASAPVQRRRRRKSTEGRRRWPTSGNTP
jgi:excisionase family DNA binding protein